MSNVYLYQYLQQSGYGSTLGTILVTHPPSAVENLNHSCPRNVLLKCSSACKEDQSGEHMDVLRIVNDDICIVLRRRFFCYVDQHPKKLALFRVLKT